MVPNRGVEKFFFHLPTEMSGREQGSKRGFSMKFKLALVALVTLFAMVGIVGYVVMAHPGSSASSVSVANRRRSMDVYTEEDPISSPDTDHEVCTVYAMCMRGCHVVYISSCVNFGMGVGVNGGMNFDFHNE